jgi:hypothetical protein
MKPFKCNFKEQAFISLHSTVLRVLTIVLAFTLSASMTADAQRRGGGGNRTTVSRGHTGNIHTYSGGNYRRNYGTTYRGNYRIHYMNRPYRGFSHFPVWGDFYWGISPFSLRFMYNNLYYYFDDGIYYRQDDDRYQVVPAPVGHKIKKLPKEAYQLNVDGQIYYYYFGTFYVPADKQYVVVEPPVGAMVQEIPQRYEKVEVEGQTYYILNGVQYKAVLQNNEVWYQVIRNNSATMAPSNPANNMNPAPADNTEHK